MQARRETDGPTTRSADHAVRGSHRRDLVLGACSSDSDGRRLDTTETESDVGDLAPGSAAINIVDLAFEPTDDHGRRRSTDIAITNADTVDHTFTLDDGTVDEAVSAGQNVTVDRRSVGVGGVPLRDPPVDDGNPQVA